MTQQEREARTRERLRKPVYPHGGCTFDMRDLHGQLRCKCGVVLIEDYFDTNNSCGTIPDASPGSSIPEDGSVPDLSRPGGAFS
jgi:hypothetical protein